MLNSEGEVELPRGGEAGHCLRQKGWHVQSTEVGLEQDGGTESRSVSRVRKRVMQVS